MAYSFVTYTSAGGQTYNVPFPYLDADHVKVLINGVETTAFTWSDAATIHLNAAPAVGAIILIKRETPRDGMDKSFSAQPRLKGGDLDEALLQAYYIGLEALDGTQLDWDAVEAKDLALAAQAAAEAAADLAATYTGNAGAGTYAEVPSAPTTAVNEVKMYAKETSGTTELFIRKENNGSEVQVTSGTGLSVTDATESVAGLAELATQAEVDAGTDDARIVTPKKLADYAEHRGMKNLLINGCMRVCQRGSQPLDVQTRYGLDRWYVFWGASAGVTPGTQERLPYASTTYLETTSCMALAGLTCTGTNSIYVNQRIESANAKTFLNGVNHGKWSGQFKFWHNFGSSVNVYLVIYSANATDNFSAITARYVSSAQSVPTSTWTSLKFEGIDIPTTDMYNGLQFSIKIETPVCSGKTIYIGDAQFEIGPKCTTIERRPYGLELALCQRYYEKSYDLDTVPGTGTAAGCVFHHVPSLSARANVRFQTRKRAAPALTYYASSDGEVSKFSCSDGMKYAGTVLYLGENGFTFWPTGISVGYAVSFHWVCSAEL